MKDLVPQERIPPPNSVPANSSAPVASVPTVLTETKPARLFIPRLPSSVDLVPVNTERN